MRKKLFYYTLLLLFFAFHPVLHSIEVLLPEYRLEEGKKLQLVSLYTDVVKNGLKTPLIKGELFWFEKGFTLVFDSYYYESYRALSFRVLPEEVKETDPALIPSNYLYDGKSYFSLERVLPPVMYYGHRAYNSQTGSYFFFGWEQEGDRYSLYELSRNSSIILKKYDYFAADQTPLFKKDILYEEAYLASNTDFLAASGKYLYRTSGSLTRIYETKDSRAVSDSLLLHPSQHVLQTAAVNNRLYYLWDIDRARDPLNLTGYFYIEHKNDSIYRQAPYANQTGLYHSIVTDKHSFYVLQGNVLYRNGLPLAKASYFERLYSYGGAIICGNSSKFALIRGRMIREFENTGNERLFLDNCAFYDDIVISYRNEGAKGYLYVYKIR